MPMTTAYETSEAGRSAGSKLGWLIVGRLFTAVLLFVVGLIWNRDGSLAGNSLVLLSTVATFTIIYTVIWRLSRNTLLQAKFQLAVDVLLVTWLVWESNVIQSPYVALYIVVIAASSLFLNARDAELQSRSDVRLLAATQSLASLRALHERIVASIRSGVVTTDLEGRIYTFNVAAQEITRYPAETLRGKD